MREHSIRRALLVVALTVLAAPVALAQEHTVTVDGAGFEPADMTVAPGDTVAWTNGGGLHNVVAVDGSFLSGPPSTDLWTYSFAFHQGGTYDYFCEVHVGAGEEGTITVEGVFGDRFESGDFEAWSQVQTPERPNCNCYFSSDCVAPTGFCNWGPGGFTVEDICTWRDNKPVAPGTGCDLAYDGPWIPAICDGLCTAPGFGSALGWEDLRRIREGVGLWAEAMLGPAEAGGGPIDAGLADRAMSLDFKSPDAAVSLGRQVADLLVVAGIPAFYDHFCHFEGHPGETNPALFVDLSEDPCRRTAARLAIDALLAELGAAGSAPDLAAGIREACPDWRGMFAPRCPDGDGALACFERRVADLAVFLKTPQAVGAYLERLFSAPPATGN